MSSQLGRPQRKLHERSLTRDISRKIRSPAMHVVRAGMTGGPYGDVSVCRCIGDFGFSVFLRPVRCYRSEASSLNRVRGSNIPSAHPFVASSLFAPELGSYST